MKEWIDMKRTCVPSSVFVGGFMSYLHYSCLFAHSGVQHILCYVFVLFFLCLVYPLLPVSMDCPFLIAPLVFSNVYLHLNYNVLIKVKTEYFDCGSSSDNHYMVFRMSIIYVLNWFWLILFVKVEVKPLSRWTRLENNRNVWPDSILI